MSRKYSSSTRRVNRETIAFDCMGNSSSGRLYAGKLGVYKQNGSENTNYIGFLAKYPRKVLLIELVSPIFSSRDHE